MKRVLASTLVLGLLTSAWAGPSAAGREQQRNGPRRRAVEGSYQTPALLVVGLCDQNGAIGCIEMGSGPKERFLTATVADLHGQPVAVAVTADLDGDQYTETVYGAFCGHTSRPIRIDPLVVITFWIGITPETVPIACAPGTATQGKVRVTFSDRR